MATGGHRTPPMQIELPPSRFADLDGPVHYVEWDGPPGRTLVLVHGLGGSLLSWLAVAPGLARHDCSEPPSPWTSTSVRPGGPSHST